MISEATNYTWDNLEDILNVIWKKDMSQREYDMQIIQELTPRIITETRNDFINGIVRLQRMWRTENEKECRLIIHCEIEKLENDVKDFLTKKYNDSVSKLDRGSLNITANSTGSKEDLSRTLKFNFKELGEKFSKEITDKLEEYEGDDRKNKLVDFIQDGLKNRLIKIISDMNVIKTFEEQK